MSNDLLAEIAEDIANYKHLCSYFNEPIQYVKTIYGTEIEDCYGEHAKELDARFESTFVIKVS